MRVPQVSERIKEAPVVLLRGMLAGIGQVLLITDKLRNKVPAQREADVSESAAAPVPEAVPEAAPAPAGAAPAPEEASPQAAAPEEASAQPEAAVAAGPEGGAEVSAAAQAVTAETVAPEAVIPEAAPEETAVPEAVVAKAAPAETTAAGAGSLPLANYDELTVPSLRARLRNLTAAQVTALLEYEQGHAARAEVIAMFERRIAKLAAGD